MGDYIPSSFPNRLAWSANFSTKLTAMAVAVGATAAQATAYAALHATFVTSQTAASDPSTKTSTTVLARDIAWQACEAMARDLAAIIQAHIGTTPVQLNDLGLTVRDTTKSPVGPPTTKGIVNIERILNLAHVLRIRDEATPTSNARPPGAAGWEVWAKIGGTDESEPLSVEECKYMGLATRVPYTVQFAPDDKNKTVWYLVRAVNNKGQAGPLSDQISGTIAA